MHLKEKKNKASIRLPKALSKNWSGTSDARGTEIEFLISLTYWLNLNSFLERFRMLEAHKKLQAFSPGLF